MSQIPDKLKLNIHLMADVDTLSVRATSLRDEVRGEITPPSINLLKRLANHNLSDIPQATLYAVGKTLYVRLTAGNIGHLLQETLHEAAKSKQTVQLNLIFEADQLHLTQFPWEMMADDMGRFLLREGLVDVTRFIHYPQSVPRLHAPLEESPFLRAVAQPNGLPLLKPMALPLRKLDTLPNANLDQLSQRLLIERRNIWGMQFDGYSGVVQQCLYCQTLNPLQSVSCYRCGVSSADAPTVSALAFENEGEAAWISTTRLGELFFNTQDQNTPATLLTMPYAPEINLGGEHLLFHGAAPHLVLAGVPAVMGLQFSASYEFTSNFMNQFYLALLEHHDPQIAMRLARQQSSRETWYSPLLYLRHKKLPDITASSDQASPTRNIDTLVPNQVRTGKTFFVRLWIRHPAPFILRQGSSQAGIPFQSPQTNGAKIDLDALDLGRTETDLIEHLIQERAIRYGDLEVYLSPSDDASGMYTITPNKVKLFVDDKVDAPPAVFTIKTQQAGPFSLNFSLWQDGEEIASIIREIQAVDGSLPSRVVLENNSLSIAIQGLISDVPDVHLEETGKVCPNCGSNNYPNARYCSHCGHPLEEAYSLQSGRLPGDRPPPPGPLTPNFYLDKRYLINRQIEQDGIGTTYQAIDTRLHQRCLVRETIFAILPNTLEWEHTFANFNREAQVLAALYHPNLRHLNDYFSAGGRHYTIFQYVEGLTLHERMALRDRQPMPEPLVQAIGVQLCSLLEYLHGHTLIWLDIQPKNLIFQDDGQVVMTNLFPLSSRGGVPTGTTSTSSRSALVSNFTAPEVYKNQADARSNIYAVGMTMYYLLTGEAPPNLQTLSQFDPRPRLNQHTSAELSAIVTRALHYNPAERWQSATEMAWALQGITLRERLGSLFEYGINPEQRRYAWSMSDAQTGESERQPETQKSPVEWDTVRAPSPQATPLTQDLLTWLSRFFWLPIPILLTLLLCSGLILFGINNLLPRQTTIVPTTQNEGLISGSNVTPTLSAANDLIVLPTLTNTPMPTFTPLATPTPTLPPAPSPSPTTPPLPSATPTPEPITGRVVIDGPGTLNVRQAPNLNAARVGLLNQGEVVTIISRNDQGDWFEILSLDGLQGWVSAQFLEVSGNFNAIEQNVDLPPSPVTGVVSIDGTSDLNVRQGPDVTYNLVSDLPNGTTVALLRRTGLNDWFEVSLPDGGTGWVSADFITVSGNLSEVELIAGVP